LRAGERGPTIWSSLRRGPRVPEAQTGPGGLIPEQVWDGPPIPSRELAPGKPSGSAMPLVWAHAEYVKLLRSLADGAVFDMPPHAARRYRHGKHQARRRPWREDCPVAKIPAERALRLDFAGPATVLYTRDDWRTQVNVETKDTGLGLFVAEIATDGMRAAQRIVFTWRDAGTGAWRGRNFEVAIAA